jgi:hypothetical protein
MSHTVESVFRVKSVNDKEVWLYDIDKKLTVAIESKNSLKYDNLMRNKITSIESGDIIEASLESQNELCTIWIFNNIKVIQ